MATKYIVKSCLSGDTLVLQGRPAGPGQKPSERIVHVAEVAAPRLGTSQRDDEPFAFESREYLRALTVGKEITFESTYSVPSNDGIPRDVGHIHLGPQALDLTIELLRTGWAKLKENRREATDEDIQRRAIETDARNSGRGIWNAEGPPARNVYHTMPSDSQGFMSQWKGKPINGIVEGVRDGSNMRIRLILKPTEHQFVNLTLAGVKCPRAAGREGDVSEPFGEEAKAFVEFRLLQRPVSVTLLSLPAPPATSFSALSSEAVPSASSFIGSVIHTSGANIAEHLVGAGLGKVVDWHAGMLSTAGGTEKLRAAEKSAKEKKLKVYGLAPSAPTNGSSRAASTGPSNRTQFEGPVVRVWSGDQISVYDESIGKDRRLQLSSVRSPRANDPKQASYAAEAKEFLRKKLIGKTVSVRVDFIRPREGEYEERECASISMVPPTKQTVAEQLIEKGLATAVRHRRDDENRSPDYDKLMAAEQSAVAGTKGLHSGKETPLPRVVNASETHSKAQQFFPSFKRAGRVSAIVEHVAAGSRFKLVIPKDNQSLTFVLSGIRAPRSGGRNTGEKAEPYGNESLEFATRRYLQRDVEVQFENVDKSGGFIGALFIPQPDKSVENAAVALVREGFATVHDYSAEGLSWSKQLYDAQEEAKKAQKNIWKNWVDEPEVEATASETALDVQYLDVIISDVRSKPQFGFSVQILNNEGIQTLERLMRDFSLHHKSARTTPLSTLKAGELVSAKFSGDDGWYRAKVRRFNPTTKQADVVFIDYGNQESVPIANIRQLDDKFRSLPGQAQDARLSFVKMVDPSGDYYDEAVDRFRSICESRKLIANIDAREGPVLHLRLIDPSEKPSPTDSINSQLVREGFCVIDRKGCNYLQAYPAIAKRLADDTQEAKKTRSGMYEFGDISPEDD